MGSHCGVEPMALSLWFALFLMFVQLSVVSTLPVLIPRDNNSTFLPNWIGHLMPAIGDATLLDLSLPGTHDTLTYDLSTTVSDGGLDDYPDISAFLHDFPWLSPGSFIKTMAHTQGLNVVQQLDSGVRFFDIRIMLESQQNDWYGLHCLETNQPA